MRALGVTSLFSLKDLLFFLIFQVLHGTNKVIWHCHEKEHFNTLDPLIVLRIICFCPLHYKSNQMRKSVEHPRVDKREEFQQV